MSKVTVTLTESPGARTGVSTDVGTFFAVLQTDQGPSTPTKLSSMQDFINQFGDWSTTNNTAYNAADGFFQTNAGSPMYVQRALNGSESAATVTLNDATSTPTVILTYKTPGVAGNNYKVQVTSTQVLIEDSTGVTLEAFPYSGSNAAILSATSNYVTFRQSASNTNAPASAGVRSFSGGANPTNLTDAELVSELASFNPELGPGTVAVPGSTSSTVANGVFGHALNNNRFAVVEMIDNPFSANVINELTSMSIAANAQKAGIVVQGQPIFSVGTGAGRVYPSSGVVAGLRDAATSGGSNPPAAFATGQLPMVLGFTTAYNNLNNTTDPAYVGSFTQADVDSLTDAGICFFGFDPLPCLDEFVTPATDDDIFFQATAWSAATMLVSQCQSIGQGYKGKVIDGQGILLADFAADLSSPLNVLYTNNVLFGSTSSDAYTVVTGSPVNTTATAAEGELNAQIAARLAPYADKVNITIKINSLTQVLGS